MGVRVDGGVSEGDIGPLSIYLQSDWRHRNMAFRAWKREMAQREETSLIWKMAELSKTK